MWGQWKSRWEQLAKKVQFHEFQTFLAGYDWIYLKTRGQGEEGQYIYAQEQTESDSHGITWKYTGRKWRIENEKCQTKVKYKI